MPRNCNDVSCLLQNFEKNLEFTSGVWVFFTFLSSSIFMAASWLPIFISVKPSQIILSIDRSEPRFESHTEGKIRKTLKHDENFAIFC